MAIMLSSFLKDCGDERHRQLGASITTVFRTGLAATANCLSRCFGILPTLQILAGSLTVGGSVHPPGARTRTGTYHRPASSSTSSLLPAS